MENQYLEIIESKKTFVIAEIGVNHNGKIEMAMELIDSAIDTGADAVKFQIFNPADMILENTPTVDYQKFGSKASNQFSLLEQLRLDKKQLCALKDYCERKNILFLLSPFDKNSIEFLENIKVQVIKIPSGEITNYPLLSKIAQTTKPIILSTGMSDMEEIKEAVHFLKSQGISSLSLLHCVSDYPTKVENINLGVIPTLHQEFQLPIGLSDHTMSIVVPALGVALGAKVVEKHLTMDRSLPGPDQKSSLEPVEFKQMVKYIREAEIALGDGRKTITSDELKTRDLVRKSLVLTKNVSKGHILREGDLTEKRPGMGISPKEKSKVIGKSILSPLKKNQILSWQDIA